MISYIYSYSIIGLDAHLVTIEIDIHNGLPLTTIVGLPDNVIKESKERVRSAIKNSGYKYPHKRITVNLSPAHVKKAGSAFELAIALGILSASEQIPTNYLSEYAFLGELSLDGSIKAVHGCLPVALELDRTRFKGLIIPQDNAKEASLCKHKDIHPIHTLNECIDNIQSPQNLDSIDFKSISTNSCKAEPFLDFHDVKGQAHVKRGLEIAAAGGHNVIMIGPPGCGKSMLAKRFSSILPNMSEQQSFETTKIYSVMGLLKNTHFVTRHPFRAVHHTTSAAALVGGGTTPKPGEITLSHNGVLFLDELPEFSRNVLESLRQPLEDKTITITRANSTMQFPANFILLSAMNPCPCGHLTNPYKKCQCSQTQVQRYLTKISGPLLDRIDIHLEVPALNSETLLSKSNKEEYSINIKSRTIMAREHQHKRFEDSPIDTNAHMSNKQINQHCQLNTECQTLIKQAIEHLNLSARAHDKILKIARTIADLDGQDDINQNHIAEAIQYRCLDRNWWG